jgi:hypothetical protein
MSESNGLVEVDQITVIAMGKESSKTLYIKVPALMRNNAGIEVGDVAMILRTSDMPKGEMIVRFRRDGQS